MKLTLETQEWQLLGQLALESARGDVKADVLPAFLLLEFYLENLPAFTQPRDRKKKLKNSTAIGIFFYLQKEEPRKDPLWDITLQALRDKLHQKIINLKTATIITLEASAN